VKGNWTCGLLLRRAKRSGSLVKLSGQDVPRPGWLLGNLSAVQRARHAFVAGAAERKAIRRSSISWSIRPVGRWHSGFLGPLLHAGIFDGSATSRIQGPKLVIEFSEAWG